jgi:hypothetical protein
MKTGVFLVLLAITYLFLLGCDYSKPNPTNFVIVPGVSIGDIKANTTRQDLKKIYGFWNVIALPGKQHNGKPLKEDAVTTMLVEPDYDSSLGIDWKDPITTKNIQRITFIGKRTEWKTTDGVTLGITLKELEKINGGPFKLMGFGNSKDTGLFVSANKGKLAYLGKTGSGYMLIRLKPELTGANDKKSEIYKTVIGDKEFGSDLPAMQELNPVVSQMVLSFP